MHTYYAGKLAAVGDLSSVTGRNFVFLYWKPPFSLNVTDTDPDIWYTVLVNNVTDIDNTVSIPCTNCVNITEPFYAFTRDHPSPNDVFSFAVLPINGAGEGNLSQFLVETFNFPRCEANVY